MAEVRMSVVAWTGFALPPWRDDRDIRNELIRHFASSATFDDDEVAVEVTPGVVRLSGDVDSALKKNWAREEA